MLRAQASGGTDLVKNLLARTGDAGPAGPPVTEPAAEGVRSYRQIPFGIGKGTRQLTRVVEPAPRANSRRDLRGCDWLSVGRAHVAMASRVTYPFVERLVDEVARVGRYRERDVAPVPPVPRSQDAALARKAWDHPLVQNVPELRANVREHLSR